MPRTVTITLSSSSTSSTRGAVVEAVIAATEATSSSNTYRQLKARQANVFGVA
jgi:hypothetical protein